MVPPDSSDPVEAIGNHLSTKTGVNSGPRAPDPARALVWCVKQVRPIAGDGAAADAWMIVFERLDGKVRYSLISASELQAPKELAKAGHDWAGRAQAADARMTKRTQRKFTNWISVLREEARAHIQKLTTGQALRKAGC